MVHWRMILKDFEADFKSSDFKTAKTTLTEIRLLKLLVHKILVPLKKKCSGRGSNSYEYKLSNISVSLFNSESTFMS